jgi:hypothetical protein
LLCAARRTFKSSLHTRNNTQNIYHLQSAAEPFTSLSETFGSIA